MRSDAGLHT